MEKNNKRNELSIFEKLKIKPEDFISEQKKKNDLVEIDDVYYYYNTKQRFVNYFLVLRL